MATDLKSKLPRLARPFYQGRATVMWTHGIERRATGWLDDAFHVGFRETLLHACARYALASPCCVLMPDHWHVVLMGLSGASDQWLGNAFLRKHLGPRLKTAGLQDRAHDHVLREDERRTKAFQAACSYVCYNPQRAGLRGDWRDWPYLGALIAGYPDLDPRRDDHWDDYWKIYHRQAGDHFDPGAPTPGGEVSHPLGRSGRSGTDRRP